MFDTNKLRGKIIEVYGSQKAFARKINKPQSYVSQILAGKRYLGQVGIELWAKELCIEPCDFYDYFFTLKVREKEL